MIPISLTMTIQLQEESQNMITFCNLNLEWNLKSKKIMKKQPPLNWVLIHLPVEDIMTVKKKIYNSKPTMKHTHLQRSNPWINQTVFHHSSNTHRKWKKCFHFLILHWTEIFEGNIKKEKLFWNLCINGSVKTTSFAKKHIIWLLI